MGSKKITRRQYLTREALIGGTPVHQVTPAVDSLLRHNPDWDEDERRTWEQWKGAAADEDA